MPKRRPKAESLFDRMDEGSTVLTRPPGGWGGGTDGGSGGGDEAVSLQEAAETRYLNYALSVITSRALPDVRDGLKPVQRRILYTMWQQNLTADAKHRKCAKVVGDVMGNYHPHGDAALYETLVRMAQPFSLRYPLVDGSGNFGSLDGDSAAAMRYTECRLARISDEMLSEIDQDTVAFRPNYDGTREEPSVLPARIPNLLVNGATGIAVGMATNIPPHNLGEVCKALIEMIDADLQPLTIAQLTKHIKGPDFPTGGQIMNTQQEIREIYKTGSGSIRLRATWQEGPATRGGKTIYITSVPYTVNKSTLVERIADVALSRKLPHLVDVRDLSTDDVRIALELKGDADKRMVMAYLYKHTPLQSTFPVNLTCLVPTENALAGRPERLSLHDILWHFLHFRLEVVRNRLKFELEALKSRIHILEGFETVFDALDEIIKIVRKSDGKADAAEKIIARFKLDAEQTDAILELKIYRLARLEILVIQNELAEKRKRAKEIGGLLKREADLWKIVRSEIAEIQKTYGDARRSEITGEAPEEEYTADDFIIEEDNVVLVTRDGWVKRQKEVKDLATTRLREGRQRAGRGAGQHASDGGVLHELRRRLHGTAGGPAGVDRLRRADSEPLQVQGRREGRRRAEPRPTGDREDYVAEAGDRAAGPRRRGDERRLQPALLPRGIRRAEHACRPPLRARRRGRRGRGRQPGYWGGDPDRRHASGARDAVQGGRGELPGGSGPRRHPDQAAERGRPAAGLHRLDRRPGPHDGRDDAWRGADDFDREIRHDRPRRQGP